MVNRVYGSVNRVHRAGAQGLRTTLNDDCPFSDLRPESIQPNQYATI
jgi:hypothetical protein